MTLTKTQRRSPASAIPIGSVFYGAPRSFTRGHHMVAGVGRRAIIVNGFVNETVRNGDDCFDTA